MSIVGINDPEVLFILPLLTFLQMHPQLNAFPHNAL